MTTTSITARSLDGGRVIKTTVAVLGRNFVVFGLLAVCFAGLPAVLSGLIQINVLPQQQELTALSITMAVLGWLLPFLGTCVLQGAVTHGAITDLNGGRPSLGACLLTGLRFALPLLVLGVATGIALVFGFILLVVPAVMMATAWAVAVPALVVERPGIFAAFGRSAVLTRGQRWQILALFILLVVVGWLIQSVLLLPLGAFTAKTTLAIPLRVLVGLPLVSALQGLIGATGAAVLYFELRRTKEGVGVEALASIFD